MTPKNALKSVSIIDFLRDLLMDWFMETLGDFECVLCMALLMGC